MEIFVEMHRGVTTDIERLEELQQTRHAKVDLTIAIGYHTSPSQQRLCLGDIVT